MRFLVVAALLFIFLLSGFFIGIGAQQMTLVTLSFCGIGLIGWPALMVAFYRLFSGAADYEIRIERRVNKARRQRQDSDAALGVR